MAAVSISEAGASSEPGGATSLPVHLESTLLCSNHYLSVDVKLVGFLFFFFLLTFNYLCNRLMCSFGILIFSYPRKGGGEIFPLPLVSAERGISANKYMGGGGRNLYLPLSRSVRHEAASHLFVCILIPKIE